MQRQAIVRVMITLLCALVAATIGSGQQVLRDTPSHRFIPPGIRPLKNDFETPEYQSARSEFQKLYRSTRELRRALRKGGAPPTVNTFDPATIDQLSPATKELVREWSRDSVADVSREIGREIVEFNRRLSQNAGLPEPDSNGDSLPFEFSADLLKQFEDAKKAWAQQKSATDSKYAEALKQYRDTWPHEKIPPGQWLEKVQPFINAEIIEQLMKVRDYQDGKTSEPPEIPAELGIETPAGLSERMVASVVKTLDQGGNELIQRAKRSNQGNQQSPWWKRIRAKAKSRIKSLNRSITDRTEQYAATASAVASPVLPSRGSGRSTYTWSGSDLGRAFGLTLFLLGAGYLFYRWKTSRAAAVEQLHRLTDAAAIRDRESLLHAIHEIAVKRFGASSRFWHHRQLFTRLRETYESHDPMIEHLYERLRYAPDGDSLSDEEAHLARRWYEQIRTAGAKV